MTVDVGAAHGPVAVLGIDLTKHVFHLHGIDAHGPAVVSKRVSRAKLAETVVQLAPRVVAMEACCGAPCWGACQEFRVRAGGCSSARQGL
jgi:hypothetical protein